MTSETPVRITYSVDGKAEQTEDFDFLIVACDPRALPIPKRTETEKDVVEKLTSFTFQTSLFKAKRPDPPAFAVRFHPGVLNQSEGGMYGFRDEVMAHSDNIQPDPLGTFCTTYQLSHEPLIGSDRQAVEENLAQQREATVQRTREEDMWVDFTPDTSSGPQPEEVYLTDYFPHFEKDDLRAGWPWKIIDIQGENNTLYVSSHTCFESVLHCYLYANQIMKIPRVRDKFPTDKNAKFAICGAGPSGILFASQILQKNGYRNFKLLEPMATFGGKSQTKRRTAPSTGREIPCELGTCYLSPAYHPMYHLFEKYDAGEIVALDNEPNFRSIIDPDIAATQDEKKNGVEFGKWTALKNGSNLEEETLLIAVATVKYMIIHYAVMGMDSLDAMPPKPPRMMTVWANLLSLFRAGLARLLDEDENDELEAENLLEALPEDPTVRSASTMVASGQPGNGLGILKTLIGMATRSNIESTLSLPNLAECCRDVMSTTFAEYLDTHGMGSLKSVFTYGYSVQGYGAIDSIPTYYGLIWLTPALLQYNIISKLFPPEGEAAQRGVVNIVTKGWLTLWERMVEKDELNDRIQTKTVISKIERPKFFPVGNQT